MMNHWDRLDDYIGRIERVCIVLLLSSMILVAFAQILLRNFLATGIAWGDALIRNLVVWVGFIGASLATKENKHITIDVVSHWVSGRKSRYIQLLAYFFSAFICGLLTFAAYRFVQMEALMGDRTFLDIPVWFPGVIIPVTFGLMTFRFLLRFIRKIFGLMTSDLKYASRVEK